MHKDLLKFVDKLVNDPTYLDIVCNYSKLKYGNTTNVNLGCCESGMLLSTMTGNPNYATKIKAHIDIENTNNCITFYQDSSNIIYNTSINPEQASRMVIINHSNH